MPQKHEHRKSIRSRRSGERTIQQSFSHRLIYDQYSGKVIHIKKKTEKATADEKQVVLTAMI
ncbi:hypothetical protein [Tindallia californiensis]|uniref:Uncharacterized protein n=1 Tax=Tindallia californiensis TaxID=159292 RepID=A0A1H3RD10_9FIRM|nr:hypothetical protein [Tindallia californiensis]SDZ23722.1 hypothetical protein SAMN05192546_1184 [Tindallia californiensis]